MRILRRTKEIVLSNEEAQALYKLLEHQYVSYENILMIDLLRSFRKLLEVKK